MDSSGCLRNLNRTACEMFGYERDQAVGRLVADLVIPERFRAAHWAGLVRLAHGEEPRMLGQRITTTACRANGDEFPVELVVVRSGDDPGSFTGFVRDISDLEEALEEGQRSRKLLSSAEQLGGVGSWTLDACTRELSWSDELYRILELDPERDEPSVALASTYTHPDDLERVRRAIRAGRAGSQPYTIEYRALLPCGVVKQLVTRTWPEHGADGEPRRFTGFIQDVTAERLRRRAESARYAISRTLREWEGLDEGIASLLRRMGVAMRWAVTALWLADGSGRLCCKGFWALQGSDADALERATRDLRVAPGEGLVGRAWTEGAPVLGEGVEGAPGAKRRRMLDGMGVTTATVFPAVADEEVVAVFEAFATERPPEASRPLARSTMRALEGMGREIGLFLAPRRAAMVAPVLSKRELEVLQLAAEGHQVSDIAEKLTISPMTVKSHLRRIYAKLGVTGRVAAVAQGLRTGLIT